MGLSHLTVRTEPSCSQLVGRNRSDQSSAPATPQIRYVNKWLAHDPESARFMGKPRPEVDEAWSDLLEGAHPVTLSGNFAHCARYNDTRFRGGALACQRELREV